MVRNLSSASGFVSNFCTQTSGPLRPFYRHIEGAPYTRHKEDWRPWTTAISCSCAKVWYFLHYRSVGRRCLR